jgi:hypothetical protein
MKKIVSTTFCILMICSLLLTVGTVMAADSDYERFSRPTLITPTLDGEWTTEDEWTDGEETWIGTDIVFRSTWDDDGDNDMTRWIVEFLTDTTNDPEDFLRFCFDIGAGSESNELVVSDRKFEITGHTILMEYYGLEGNWFDILEPLPLEWTNSLSTSSASSTPHWIYEFQMDKNEFTSTGTFEDIWYFCLQVYDASNPEFHAWPPTADTDIPNTWGIENRSTEPIPEGLTFAVMALLTTVSMLVGYKYFVKRKETK